MVLQNEKQLNHPVCLPLSHDGFVVHDRHRGYGECSRAAVLRRPLLQLHDPEPAPFVIKLGAMMEMLAKTLDLMLNGIDCSASKIPVFYTTLNMIGDREIVGQHIWFLDDTKA